jgi:hypothetical protein
MLSLLLSLLVGMQCLPLLTVLPLLLLLLLIMQGV